MSATYLDQLVEWKEEKPPEIISPDSLYATHSGVLNIGGISLRCYRLNDGQAVFDADDFAKFFSALTEDGE